jgi:hypothetical protein
VSGERDLARLLAGMRPSLRPGVWHFAKTSTPTPEQLRVALATFREDEGMTLVLAEADAMRLGVAGDFRAAWIVLEIHSDLAAVGFLARVAAALAAAGIPANAISAFHHDHLFVPHEARDRALAVLEALAEGGDLSRAS